MIVATRSQMVFFSTICISLQSNERRKLYYEYDIKQLVLIRAKFKLVFFHRPLLLTIRSRRIKNHKYCDILYDLFIYYYSVVFHFSFFVFSAGSREHHLNRSVYR